uniref:SHSP domain-containing protein n=1 Tax=Panagrolaimus sp. ES5 TaxID=591445 RepID=A0AC34FEY0_9BILA
MSILPYNPYFDGPTAPFAGVGPYHPYGAWQGAQHPFFGTPFAWHPFAMLRAAEHQLWHQHQQVVNPQRQQQAIMPNGEFNYQMNAIGYKPEELGVDINGHEVVISGQHRTDHQQHGGKHQSQHQQQPSGHHQFYRRFTLPPGIKPDSLKCDVDENGNLAISGKVDPNYQQHQLAIENGPLQQQHQQPHEQYQYRNRQHSSSERSSSNGGGGRRTPIPIRHGSPPPRDGVYRGQPAISY